MRSSLSRTCACGVKLMYAALQVLESHDGSCRVSDLRSALASSVSFSEWELELVGDAPRWNTFLSWYSTCYAAAGYLVKKRGVWFLTDEGKAALSRPAEDVFVSAQDAYRSLRGSSGDASCDQPSGDIVPVSSESALEEITEKASDGIREVVATRSPYEFQDMVSALLRAMGFFTPFVAPKGRDGGIDVLAFGDPLGTSSPRVKVQVKHFPSSVVSVDVVRQLIGLLADGDSGLVVTSGSFTSEALRAARDSSRRVRLIDGDEFVSLWIQYYSKMPEEDKRWLRIVPVFFASK